MESVRIMIAHEDLLPVMAMAMVMAHFQQADYFYGNGVSLTAM